ncbi:unnamed protein product, partial [Staurois parvus]
MQGPGRPDIVNAGSWETGYSELVVSGKNVPYIGGQWEECPLHWWSV